MHGSACNPSRARMLAYYHVIEFIHIFTAIVALGTSAGLGIVLEFYADHPVHGAFILEIIRRLLTRLVLPGYLLMLLTGLGMVSAAELWTAQWVRTAIALWCVGLLALVGDQTLLARQLRELTAAGRDSARYRRLALAGRAVGAAAGLIVAVLIYVMVFRPEAGWLPW